MNYPINQVVLDVGEMNITGNVIPMNWIKHLRRKSTKSTKSTKTGKHHPSKPHHAAIMILGDIVYWHRPTIVRDEATGLEKGRYKKFKLEKLQRKRRYYVNLFGYSMSQVSDALKFLKEQGVISLEYKTVTLDDGQKLYNCMYIGLNVSRLKFITYEDTPVTKNHDTLSGPGAHPIAKNHDTNTETTNTETTTDKKTSGKKMPDQTPIPPVSSVFPMPLITAPISRPSTHPPNPIPDTSTSVQEPVSVAPKPDEALATRKEPLFLADIEKKLAGEAAMYTNAQAAAPPPPCPGCTFKMSGPCDPEKCDCVCHQEQGEIGDPFWVEPPLEAQFLAGEGVVDKSGVPVSDATRAALRDVMEAPVGLPDDPCDEQFTELVNVLDLALASEDVSDMVKGIFRDARDKLTPVGKSGVAGPLPDDDPRYEVPFQDAGGRAGSAVVNNLASGMASAVIPPVQPSTVGIAPASVAISAPDKLTKKQVAALAFDLEAYFCEIAGLKKPNRSTAYFAKKAHVRWGNPCKEMMRLADYDLAKAKRLMDAAWAEVVKDNWQGKISTAQSIENYFGAQSRGPGKAVAMPSGPLGLTKAQQNTSLFGQRNGGK